VETAPVTTDERIGLKILNEIVSKENSPIESLTETKTQKYKEKLLDIADELSEKDIVADDAVEKVLKQWNIPLIDKRHPVSTTGTLMLAGYLTLFAILLIFLLFALYPRWDFSTQQWSNSVRIGSIYRSLDLEIRLILTAAAAGALGAILHALRSLTVFVGNRTLVSSWVFWYLIQPLTGMLAAVIFFFVLRATPLLGSPPQIGKAFFSIAAISALVGMFSDRATLKLSDVFDKVFRSKSPFELRKDERIPDTVITSIEPASGTEKGGTLVTITGRFTGSTTVLFGGVAGTSVQLIDSTTLFVTTPPHPAGVVDFTVVSDRGQAVTQRGGFLYTSQYRMSTLDPMQRENAKDVLLGFLKEYYARLQHYETQRSTVSNLLVVIAPAILAFVTFDRALTLADLPLTVLLVFTGLLGAGFCLKYYERAAKQMDRIEKIRYKIDEVLFDSVLIAQVRAGADKQHAQEFPEFEEGGRLSWMRVSKLWIIFHLCVALMGLILSIMIYFV
jgi:hypothetical protein